MISWEFLLEAVLKAFAAIGLSMTVIMALWFLSRLVSAAIIKSWEEYIKRRGNK